jgi:penicillin-binding protein 1C
MTIAMSRFFRSKFVKILGAAVLAALLTLAVYFYSFDPAIFADKEHSTDFLDRRGTLLRTYFSSRETYARQSPSSEVSPHFLRAIVLIEDHRFYSHHGVSLSSLLRATWQNIEGQRVVSGGSTITMQLAKLVYRHRERSILNKISEIFAALRFEWHMPKEALLEEYINRLPFGNLVYGVNEASRFYFGKQPSQLSLNQSIYLALIPKSPSRYNPRKHLGNLKKRWNGILEIFRRRGYISHDEFLRAQKEGIQFSMDNYPFRAPHFVQQVKQRLAGKELPQQVRTTLDLSIQSQLEGLVRGHLQRLRPYRVSSAAAVVIDNRSHQVVGYVGSPSYFDEDISGSVDMATAMRQPGSTLKPFVYALALENGYTPSSILPDIKFPARGGFFPKNHDGKEHGPLRLRVALACSYNIPAFYMAMKLTPAAIIEQLHLLGFSYFRDRPGFYGETIALGSGEVRLLDLAVAYSSLADNGLLHSPAFVDDEAVGSRRVMTPQAAYLIWHILADPMARFASFGVESSMNLPFAVAMKTGTSKGFRDKWAVAVNTLYTVAVWIGNPDGRDMADLTGVGTSATIARDIFLALQKDWTIGTPPVPPGIVKRTVCALSGQLAGPHCRDRVDEYYMESNIPTKSCSYHVLENGRPKIRYPELYKKWASGLHQASATDFVSAPTRRISFPQHRDFFYISDAIPRQDQQINVQVMGFQPGERVSLYLNDQLLKHLTIPGTIPWRLKRGDYTLVLKQGDQIIDRLEFLVR